MSQMMDSLRKKANKEQSVGKYRNKYGRCEFDDYICNYKDKAKIEACAEYKENDDGYDE